MVLSSTTAARIEKPDATSLPVMRSVVFNGSVVVRFPEDHPSAVPIGPERFAQPWAKRVAGISTMEQR